MDMAGNVVCVILAYLVTVSSSYISDHPNNIVNDGAREDDVVCSGFMGSQGFSISGNLAQWYARIQRSIPPGCTYVEGSVLITYVEDPNIIYDFEFLRTIRYVRGYVLIAVVDYQGDLPFDDLEIIRGNHTIYYGGQETALSVLLTNVTRIRMPKLKEISSGGVVMRINGPNLKIETSRSWSVIMRGRPADDIESSTVLVNEVSEDRCPSRCARRCYGRTYKRCCHSQCAGGCSGPRSTQCERCKDYNLQGNCVSHCPDLYYPWAQRCVQV